MLRLKSLKNDWSPPPFLTNIRFKSSRGIIVVRDDLLPGGTKQRAVVPFLKAMKKYAGIKEFIYASPFSGYAQIALAISCNATNTKCTLFAEQENGKQSEFTSRAAKFATVHLCDNLEAASTAADRYVKAKEQMVVPLGFNNGLFKRYLSLALLQTWKEIQRRLRYSPSRIWLPVGSGTLVKTMRTITQTKLACVDVGVLNENDPRIVQVKNLNNIEYYRAKEKFIEPCKNIPPIPSNMYYDAKIWQFVLANADAGDLWWNVA